MDNPHGGQLQLRGHQDDVAAHDGVGQQQPHPSTKYPPKKKTAPGAEIPKRSVSDAPMAIVDFIGAVYEPMGMFDVIGA